ncbi:MAG: DUF87 domain-containing protein [Candidatus Thermoplasmatota archaeon]|nr:DUF87 domain-containing protein [Candidatus Thermoplasmatota archaeon]
MDRLAEYLNGRYTDPNGLGRNIGLDPREGIVVESSLRPLIDEKSGYVVLGRSSSAHKKWRRKGLLQIGAVGELQETGDNLFGREVYIDAAFPHIMFICGKRGSGKSYTLGIFAEELIRSAIGVGVILVDPIGIFWSLKTENTSRSERKALEKWGLNPTSFPEVKVLAPGNDIGMLPANCDGPYTIGVSEMTAEDWCQVFDMDRFKTQGLLVGTAIDQVRSGYKALIDEAMIDIPSRPQLFSIGDIIRCMEFSSTIISKTGGYNPQTRRSVIARFTAAAGWGIFSIEGTPLRELTSPNRVTVLDVSDTNLGDSKRSLITGIIARKVLEGRIRSARKEEHHGFDETDPEMIPLTWLLIDEAHIILPHNKQTPASEALIEYAKQGRRPGCAMILATQRPASTSDEILSQVDILLGHNLALEDDMSALRRRVPAKLPQEFAVSDFIRGIPVGTAIVADQKTQQRSFLVRLRPRLSHHAGSSAMPKAFQEKKGRMKRPIPLTGTYIPRNMPSVLDPTPVPRSIDDIGEIEEIDEDPSVSVSPVSEVIADVPEDLDIIPEGPVPDLPWGSTIILRDRSKEDLEMFLGNVEGATGFMLLSADDPSRLSVPSGPKRVDRWFSETDSCPIRDPNGPEMALSAIENTIGETSSWVVVIDHVENMFKEHPKEKIRGMLKALHDRVFEGKHLLVIRWDGEDREGMLQGIFSVKDGVEKGPGPSMRDRKEGLMPTKIVQNGSLRDEELRWMCNVMGLPTDGNDTELLNRLLESGKGILNESSGDNVNIDLLKQVMHESTRAREENNRLLQRIKELESEIGVDTPAEPLREMQVAEKGIKKDRKLVVVWEDEEQQQGKVEQFIQEVEDLKSEIENGPIEGSPAEFSDTLFSKLMNKLDEEKLENRERLKRLEEILQNEMDSFRDELESQRKKMTASRRIPKLRVIKEKPPHMEHTDVKNRVLKRKVLKRGEEVAAVSPRIETNQALDIGKRNLKRSIFRGPKESIDDIIPYNILLYRFLVGYRGGLRRSDRESDVFIDSITGEIVEQGRTGLRRSEGLPCLLRMTDLEMDVFAVLTTSPKEPSWISKASGIDVARVKRSLSSLEKKGLVRRVRIEGNLDLFSIGDNIKIPSRPWVRDHGFEPAFVICKGERILTPRITVNDARTVIERLSRQIDIIEQDTVRYPIHVIKIRGEGRTRYIAVDGFGGRLDRRISNILKNIIEGGN